MSRGYTKWFSDLYDKSYEDLYRYLSIILYRKGKQELSDEIQECIQETFALVWQKRETLISYRNVNAWMRKAAQNILNNKISSANTRTKHTAFSLDKAFTEDGEAVIDRIDLTQPPPSEDANELLAQIRDSVGEDTYALLIEYYDKDKPINKIMDERGLSKSGVKMRVKRAIDNFRKKHEKL